MYIARVLARSRNTGRAPLPPGPRGFPLVGNVNDLPKSGVLEAHHWLKHKELYGSWEPFNGNFASAVSGFFVLNNMLLAIGRPD